MHSKYTLCSQKEETWTPVSFLRMGTNKESAMMFKMPGGVKDNGDFIFTLFILAFLIFLEKQRQSL